MSDTQGDVIRRPALKADLYCSKGTSWSEADNITDPIELVNRGGSTSIHIDVRIEKNGDLRFSGQDIGDDLDYEYWLTVPAAEKDKLLLALIEKHYAGDALAVSTLREFMESQQIPCAFFSH